MAELLSPAGGWDSLVAAVQSGADAVYMGFGAYNARRSAKNFTEEEFAQAVRYCHLRGVKVYLTLNTLLTDRELPGAAELLHKASRLGADAQGLSHFFRHARPLLPLLYASGADGRTKNKPPRKTGAARFVQGRTDDRS